MPLLRGCRGWEKGCDVKSDIHPRTDREDKDPGENHEDDVGIDEANMVRMGKVGWRVVGSVRRKSGFVAMAMAMAGLITMDGHASISTSVAESYLGEEQPKRERAGVAWLQCGDGFHEASDVDGPGMRRRRECLAACLLAYVLGGVANWLGGQERATVSRRETRQTTR